MNPIRQLSRHIPLLTKALLFAGTLSLLLLVMPREGRFKYEYSRGKPWMHENLIAPFDFSILKPAGEFEAQKARLLSVSRAYFEHDPTVAPGKRKVIAQAFLDFMQATPRDTLPGAGMIGMVYRQVMDIADSIYRRGIIQSVPGLENITATTPVMYVFRKKASEVPAGRFFTIRSAYEYLVSAAMEMPSGYRQNVKLALEMGLAYNIAYNPSLTEKAREQMIEGLSAVKGLVQEGEKVIAQGDLVDDDRFQVLESLKAESEKRSGTGRARLSILLGQSLLISIALLVLGMFMYFFRPVIFYDNRQLGLILLVVILMVSLTAMVIAFKSWMLYAVPVCLVPILMRVFFDTRVALYIHIITIILIGFLVPNSFEFVFLQLITGLIAIFSVANFRRRQQFLLTALYVFTAYSIVYFGLYVIQEGRFTGMKSFNFTLFAIASGALMLAYPAIYMLEKAFDMVTDITLLEISDTNIPALHEFSARAPGTFQHSLQVANLAEEVVREIGGNPLLVRAGALYHDIGKMDMPMYFIENQFAGFNPHEELSPAESAEIIISHVKSGIQKARKLNLPEQIIDFIRTHHGTRKVEYFYHMSLKENLGSVIDDADFSYKGPIPFSKETCVLMMADSVEAATRSMHRPDEQKISGMVDSIIDSLVSTRQFDNAGITFRDITRARKVLKKRLMHIYHLRVEYPA